MAEQTTDDPFGMYILEYIEPDVALEFHKLNVTNKLGLHGMERYYRHEANGVVFHYLWVKNQDYQIRLKYFLTKENKLKFSGEALVVSNTDPDPEIDNEYDFEK